MPGLCAAHKCTNRRNNTKGVSFFRFLGSREPSGLSIKAEDTNCQESTEYLESCPEDLEMTGRARRTRENMVASRCLWTAWPRTLCRRDIMEQLRERTEQLCCAKNKILLLQQKVSSSYCAVSPQVVSRQL